MIQRFFIFCSGADTAILEDCSLGERNKYAGIGATVFFTALMAWIASSYALYTVFDSIYAATFFGLEMKIFEKEINQVLLEQKNELTLANKQQLAAQFTPKKAELDADIAALKTEIDTKEAEANALYDTYIAEAEGREGTLLLGKGPVYKEKREKHDAALAELQELKAINKEKISAIEAQIVALEGEYNKAVVDSQPIIDGFDGLMARINALSELPWMPSFFIFLLFLAIETAPIIAKLISPKGAYDLKLQDEESVLAEWVAQKVVERTKIRTTNTELNDRIYAEIAEEEEVYQYKKKKAEALLKLQADAFHDLQVKNL